MVCGMGSFFAGVTDRGNRAQPESIKTNQNSTLDRPM